MLAEQMPSGTEQPPAATSVRGWLKLIRMMSVMVMQPAVNKVIKVCKFCFKVFIFMLLRLG